MLDLLTPETRAIVQGITGRVGRAQARWMLDAGTPLVGGVTPGRGGESVEGLPVFDHVAEAVEREGATASVVFVPSVVARDAVIEAIDAGLRLIVIVTEHIPIRDTMEIKYRAKLSGTTVIGPNCPGLFVPGVGKLGIMPASVFLPGFVAIVGRSATLSYEVIGNLSAAGIGQKVAVGIGGDPVACTGFVKVLEQFEADPDITGVVLVGEIGGSEEERAARYIAHMSKPVVALIAGKSAPPGRRFGHAGAIVNLGEGAAQDKIEALRAAGALIARTPMEVPSLLSPRICQRT